MQNTKCMLHARLTAYSMLNNKMHILCKGLKYVFCTIAYVKCTFYICSEGMHMYSNKNKFTSNFPIHLLKELQHAKRIHLVQQVMNNDHWKHNFKLPQREFELNNDLPLHLSGNRDNHNIKTQNRSIRHWTTTREGCRPPLRTVYRIESEYICAILGFA